MTSCHDTHWKQLDMTNTDTILPWPILTSSCYGKYWQQISILKYRRHLAVASGVFNPAAFYGLWNFAQIRDVYPWIPGKNFLNSVITRFQRMKSFIETKKCQKTAFYLEDIFISKLEGVAWLMTDPCPAHYTPLQNPHNFWTIKINNVIVSDN